MGETFCSYISVLNPLCTPLSTVHLTARIQSPQGRSELYDTRPLGKNKRCPDNPLKEMPPYSSLDMIVQSSLTHVGVHTLRVGVSYRNDLSSPVQTMRKFYRFHVLAPLSSTHVVQDTGKTTLLELSVHNETQRPMFLDTMKWNGLHDTRILDDYMLPTCHPILRPEERVSIVYKIVQDTNGTHKNSTGTVTLGWTTAMGERGTFTTPPIHHKKSNSDGDVDPSRRARSSLVEFRFLNSSDVLPLGIPSRLLFEIKSSSSRLFLLEIDSNTTEKGFVVTSTLPISISNHHHLQEPYQVQLDILPIHSGLFNLQGISLIDKITRETFPLSDINTILIK